MDFAKKYVTSMKKTKTNIETGLTILSKAMRVEANNEERVADVRRGSRISEDGNRREAVV